MAAPALENRQCGRPDRGERAAWRSAVVTRQHGGEQQTLVSNGCGASVGLEAGYTQIGSGAASLLGQVLNLRRNDLRLIVGCGAAGAIAAAFGAPITGAFYACELIVGVYSVGSAAPILAASLSAALTAQYLGGAALLAGSAPRQQRRARTISGSHCAGLNRRVDRNCRDAELRVVRACVCTSPIAGLDPAGDRRTACASADLRSSHRRCWRPVTAPWCSICIARWRSA